MPMAINLGLKLERTPFLEYFHVKDMDALNAILKGNPISFVNVRHPFERLVSAYLDKDNGWMRGIRGKTFKEFIEDTLLLEAKESQNNQTLLKMNPHWRPYNCFCAFCNIDYQIISKTETFSEDRAKIRQVLGLEKEEKTKELHSHSGNNIQNLTRELFRNISKMDKTEIKHIYQYDFEMFEYDPDLY